MPVENRDIVQRLYEEVWNNRKREVLRELFAPSYVVRGTNPDVVFGTKIADLGKGPEAYWRALSPILAAFPDLHFTIKETVSEQDKVAVCRTSLKQGDITHR